MSVRSFLNRSVREPAYPFKRARWEWLKRREERELACPSRHGLMSFSSKDQIIGRAIYLTGEFALGEVHEACRILVERGAIRATENGHLLDIGANIGTICVPLISSGMFKSAWAFEPEAKNLRFLEKNLRQNGIAERVRLMPFGLSSSDQSAFLAKSADNFGDHRVRTGAAAAASGTEEKSMDQIELRSLDGVLRENGMNARDISLVWMDTQGHEGKILEGAASLLAARVPLVTEFWPGGLAQAGTSVPEFTDRLAAHYGSFIDLRDPELRPRAVSGLRSWAERYERDAIAYSDLILLAEKI